MILGIIFSIITLVLWGSGHHILAIIAGFVAFDCFIGADDYYESRSQSQSTTQTPKTILADPELTLAQPQPYRDPMYGIMNIREVLATYPNVHGVPGAGLNHEEARESMGQDRIEAGIRGEESLAAALVHYGVLDNPNTHVFFSVANPGDATRATDIDCVIVDGDNIYLLDAKYWSGTGTLHKVGDMAFAADGNTWTVTKSMPWALDSVGNQMTSTRRSHVNAAILVTRTNQGTLGATSKCKVERYIQINTVDSWIRATTLNADHTNAQVINEFTQLLKH